MSILEYNGGAVVAMTGKGCVAIASDMRYGVQGQTLGSNMPKVYKMTDQLFVGLPGLATDMQTLHSLLKFHHNLYKLKEERDMEPKTFSNFVSSILYEKRFGPYFVEPVIAGIDSKGEPFISAMDLIGAPLLAKDSVVSGTSSEALYGMSESLYKEDMNPEELFETISQVLLSSVNRDAFSGWGAIVHIITPEGVTTRELKARAD